MMKAVSVMEVTGNIKTMVADVKNKHIWLILIIYRWFYSAYDYIQDLYNFKIQDKHDWLLYTRNTDDAC